MKWSWKLGRIAGIRIQVHWTFLILIAWVVVVHASRGADIREVSGGVLLVLAVFACVVLHELGHALTAKRFGIHTRDITLLPIGGVARLERMPDDPKEELAVAAAGPAVNVAIAVLLFVGLYLWGTVRPVGEVSVVGGDFVVQLMWINVILVVFNLLPAFPMDGGRMLRGLLATRIDYMRATRIAATVGQGMAVLFGFIGLMGNPFLVFIAIFVYLGAQAEAQQTELRIALEGVTVEDAMMTRFSTLGPDDPVGHAVDELLAGSQVDFPIVEHGRMVGLLVRGDLVSAVTKRGRDLPIRDVMRSEFPSTTATGDLQRALAQMQAGGGTTLPVFDEEGRLVGLLTSANLGEYLMVHGAMHAASRRGGMVEALSRR